MAVSCFAQSCTTTPPPLNGQSWADNNAKNVYIDPSLSPAMQSSITSAINDFAQATGQSINILPAGTADPGSSQQDTMEFLNNPAKSPSAFSHTDTAILNNNPKQQVSSTTSFNTGYMLDPTTPAYSSTAPNAAQYVYDVTLHELGHAFGLDDAPIPKDSSGNPNYALQPAGASIMNGSMNTNDQGPHLDPATGQVVQGGIGATSVQPCDKQQITSANPLKPPPTLPHGGGGGGGSGGGGAGGDGACYDFGYDEWDDETGTLTHYYDVVCTA